MKLLYVLYFAIVITFCISCNAGRKNLSGEYAVGQFNIKIGTESGLNPAIQITHKADANKILLQTNSKIALVSAALAHDTIKMVGTPEGSFEVTDKIIASFSRQTITNIESVDSAVIISGFLYADKDSIGYDLKFCSPSDNQLAFAIYPDSANSNLINRLFLNYASAPDEHFFGFGEQLTYFDQKGSLIPVMVQEHGVGRGKPIVTQFMDITENHGGGNPFTTGIPAPHYITSKLRSLFLENKEYSEFDLRKADRVQIKLFGNQMTGRILYGSEPKGLIKEYSSYSGRMRKLPEWVDEGAILGLQGGTREVMTKFNKIEAAGIPIAGVWLQDWCGVRKTKVGSQLWWNWSLDDSLYRGYKEMVDNWQRKGIRVLTYINPFLTNAPGHNAQFAEAEKNNFLVKHKDGSLYLIKNTDFSAGLIDLSNPEACTWIKGVIKKNLIETGMSSGWMADFGEALPFDASLYNGADPYYWHNHFTEKWAEVNREAIAEAGREDDIVFFNRSGFAQSPKYSTLFWLGDQLQTWDEYDGIKSSVVGILSGGVSGFSLFHGDIGGYNAFATRIVGKERTFIARDKELEWRWEELAVFHSVYRTHEGLNPAISVQVYDDAETLAHFSRMTKLYKALSFYRKELIAEAAATGLPVIRHPFLEFPSDPNVNGLRYQFMYGSEFMIAPVLSRGKKTVDVYLPMGDWINLWTGESKSLSEGKLVSVAAPMGQPPVFYKAKSTAGTKLVEILKSEGLIDELKK